MTERLTEEQIDLCLRAAEDIDVDIAAALRQVREEKQDQFDQWQKRERYWHNISLLMTEVGVGAGDSEWMVRRLIQQRDAARTQAKAGVAELEAQAAALSSTIGQFIGCFKPDDQGFTNLPLTVLRDAKTILANLPAAVQRHLARDRAAEAVAQWADEHTPGSCCPKTGEKLLVAYRAAGGEGV